MTSTATEQTFTAPARYTGSVFATITAPTATVRVKVDATAPVARVRISTPEDATSPAAEAVRNARVEQHGQDLTVSVPEFAARPVQAATGGPVQYVSSRGMVIVNGVVQSSGPVQASGGGVEVHVTLPAGSAVNVRTVSGEVRVLGVAAYAHVETVSGSVAVAEAARVTAVTVSGGIRAGVVTDRLDAESTSGDVRVTDHAGRSCRIRTVSGKVTVETAPGARGAVDVYSSSGDVTLFGTSALTVEARTVSGDLRRY
ncbi:DUF4097 family beta strand repeat-containing protein [Streptomyces sp. NPDC006355]|uniref:DUF4097 family beta strand repeat-containing protein n=1 Tax=Streptomyces sp. NPDC006355 TaxID=3156758 RepID=UPI0033B3CF4F